MVMTQTYSLTIRGSETSPFLREQVDTLYAELAEIAPVIKRYKLQICLSVENGPRAPGPDVYSCTLIAKPQRGSALSISESSGSLYDSALSCFLALRKQLHEKKRDRVDRRNDLPRIARPGVKR
jgi:hypothetical protein